MLLKKTANAPGRFRVDLVRLLLVVVVTWCAPTPIRAASGIQPSDGFEIPADFTSGTPLLILDHGDAADDGSITVRIIDNRSGMNRPTDRPAFETRARVELPWPPNPNHKQSFRLHFNDDQPNLPLLGLPAARIWTLAGSGRDKSMLRQYLGLMLAEELRPGRSPRARFCEVISKQGPNGTYQGLFLLSEYEVDGLFMAPRALDGQTALVALNPVTGPGSKPGYQLAYTTPGGPGNDQTVARLRLLESRLASHRASEYYGARDELKLDEFVDTWLLYNVMMNYPQDRAPFYFQVRQDGRIGLEAWWNFESALDNAITPLADDRDLGAAYPWFDHLIMDSDFVGALRNKFFDLNHGPWEPSKVEARIMRLAAELGPALDRDWARWREAYEAEPLAELMTEDADERVRQTFNPVQEIVKIKYTFRQNNSDLRHFMDELRWTKLQFTEGKKSKKNLLLTLGFVATFFFIVRYVGRRM